MKDEGYLSNVLGFLPKITKTRSATEYWIPFSPPDGISFISLPQSRRVPYGYALSEALLKNLKAAFQQNSFPHHHNSRQTVIFCRITGNEAGSKTKALQVKAWFPGFSNTFPISFRCCASSSFANRSRCLGTANILILCAHLSTSFRNFQRW